MEPDAVVQNFAPAVLDSGRANTVKPGHRTSEFWLLIVANTLINLGVIDVGPDRIRGYFLIASFVGYALSRAIAKHGADELAGSPVVLTPDEVDGPSR